MTDTSPRFWSAPPDPGLTVSRVVGRDGRHWQRVDGAERRWETVVGQRYELSWRDLFWEQGPLTEVVMP
jgi:hypothetical protein